MNKIIEITDLNFPELDVYARLTEAQLRTRMETERGVFIAESPKVIELALNAGCVPLSFLMERRHLQGQGAPLMERCPGIPVYTADRDVLASLTGYALTRGILCAMQRPELQKAEASRWFAADCCTGRHCGLHQYGRDFPLGCRPWYGCSPAHSHLLRSAVPPGGTGQHGYHLSGTLGAYWRLPCGLA